MNKYIYVQISGINNSQQFAMFNQRDLLSYFLGETSIIIAYMIIQFTGIFLLESLPSMLALSISFSVLVGGVPMPRMTRANSAENPEILTRRTRSLSMEEADKPLGIYSSSPGRVGSPIKLGTSPGKGTLSTSPPS